ncbi:hypothetical protein [Peribacillus sp. NPDC056705]
MMMALIYPIAGHWGIGWRLIKRDGHAGDFAVRRSFMH